MGQNSKAAVKLQSIADATGYSASTVGYVLRGKGDTRHISPQAQEIIKRKAEQLGYLGNIFAKALKTGRSGIVAIIGRTHRIPWREHLQFLIARRLRELGLQAMIFDFYWGGNNDAELVRQVVALNPEALVISRIKPEVVPLIEGLKKRGVVVIGSEEIENIEIDQVALDRFECGRAPTLALLEHGHQRVAYTVHAQPVAAFEMHRRITGFRSALESAGLPYSDELLVPLPADGALIEQGRRLMYEKFAWLTEKGISALATFDDLIAIGLVRGAHERGLPIPDRLSVAGGGFVEDLDFFIPALSSLVFPYEAFTETIVSLLTSRLNSGAGSGEKILLKPVFVTRESTRPARQERQN